MNLKDRIKAIAQSNKTIGIIFQVVLKLLELILKLFRILFEPLKNVALLLAGAILTFGYLYFSGYLNSIADKVMPAQPTIVSYTCNDHSSSLGNLEYSMQVVVNVRNKGGSGNVVVVADGYQENDRWTKSEMIYMKPQQTSEVILTFDEISLFGGDVRCSARTFAYSK